MCVCVQVTRGISQTTYIEGVERVPGTVNISAIDISFDIILQVKWSTLRIHYGEEIPVAL